MDIVPICVLPWKSRKVRKICAVGFLCHCFRRVQNLSQCGLATLMNSSSISTPLLNLKLFDATEVLLRRPSPPLCGTLGASNSLDSNLVAPGDYVAALVPDLESPDAEFVANESWILAEIISFNPDKRQFEVEEVDAEEGSLVLALYPQTTCFPRAVADTYPNHSHKLMCIIINANYATERHLVRSTLEEVSFNCAPATLDLGSMANCSFKGPLPTTGICITPAHGHCSLYFEDPSYSDGYAPVICHPLS